MSVGYYGDSVNHWAQTKVASCPCRTDSSVTPTWIPMCYTWYDPSLWESVACGLHGRLSHWRAVCVY